MKDLLKKVAVICLVLVLTTASWAGCCKSKSDDSACGDNKKAGEPKAKQSCEKKADCDKKADSQSSETAS